LNWPGPPPTAAQAIPGEMSGTRDLWPGWEPDTQPDADDPYWFRYGDCSFLFQAGNLDVPGTVVKLTGSANPI